MWRPTRRRLEKSIGSSLQARSTRWGRVQSPEHVDVIDRQV
jgi:hypothetical protein